MGLTDDGKHSYPCVHFYENAPAWGKCTCKSAPLTDDDPYLDIEHAGRECTYRCPNTGNEILAYRDDRFVVVPEDELRALREREAQLREAVLAECRWEGVLSNAELMECFNRIEAALSRERGRG